MSQTYKIHTAVGDMLKAFNRRSRRFRQLQAIEACINGDPGTQRRIEEELRSRDLLRPDEQLKSIVSTIRSEEYCRLASLRASISQIAVDPEVAASIHITTEDGPIRIQESVEDLMDETCMPDDA